MNNISLFESNSIEDFYLLNQSFASFNGAALKFEKQYRHLEDRVRKLDLELQFKNQELKKNLKEKEELKNYFRNILESLTTGIVVVDLKGKITTFNSAAENMTGLHSNEAKGKAFDEILDSDLFPDLRLKTKEFRAIREKSEIETELLRKGKNVVNVRLSSFSVTNPQGEKIGTAFTIKNITKLKKLEEKANRTDRLAVMGEMAAEIAHEIRNPLGSIELFATTLRKDLEEFGELKFLADHISAGVRSMNSIISNLLLFIRPQQKPEFHILDILSPLNDALTFSCDFIESNDKNIDVITGYSFEPLHILGDAELLKQAFLNIIINAVQAMPEGGKLSISAKKVFNRPTDSNLIEIRFRDTGEGVSEVDISRIFDPFYTTKKRGTGLGLAIVHNIIKIHDGDITMENNKDEGTECKVTFPLCEEANGV